MLKSLKCLLLLLAPSFIFPQLALAKCVMTQISLHGEILSRSAQGLTISVRVSSTDARDRYTWVRNEITMTDNQFHSIVWFHRESLVSPGDETCTREPSLVAVTLSCNRKVLARKTLNISKDFRKTEDGNFELTSPLHFSVPMHRTKCTVGNL